MVADLVAAATTAGGDVAAEAMQDNTMMRWVAARQTMGKANSDAIDRHTSGSAHSEAKAGDDEGHAEMDRAVAGAWLESCGFGALPAGKSAGGLDGAQAAHNQHGDVYGAIHRHITDIMPAVVLKTFDPVSSPPTDAECGLLWFYAYRGNANEQGGKDLVTWDYGGVQAADMGTGMQSLVLEPLQHCFAFAVPSTPALDAIAGLGCPVVELGAGTGYWAALLQGRGVDVLPLDHSPPTPTALNSSSNVFFHGTFTAVSAGCPADLAAHSDRALMLCWPYNFEVDVAWDVECLDHWTGNTLVHIGEWVQARSATWGTGVGGVLTSAQFPRGTANTNSSGNTTSRAFQAGAYTRSLLSST
jgi:hypothetical protein